MLCSLGVDLITEFLIFQDKVEEAIAQSTVLPRFLSLLLYLKPVESMRLRIVKKLEQVINSIWKELHLGMCGVCIYIVMWVDSL